MSASILLALLRFETPGHLVWLALLPLLVVLSYRSLAGLGAIRRWFAITARCAVVTLIVLALAGAQRTRDIDELSVVFLVDRSKSIPEPLQAQAFDYIKQAAEGRQLGDRLAVVAFDAAADIEQTPQGALGIDAISEPYNPDHTNIAGAARLALALLPSDTTGRVVLLSDGNENVGSALREAGQFRAADVPIDIIPIEYDHDNEVVVESLKAPPTGTAEETIRLQMVLHARRHVTGRILLHENDTLVDLEPDNPGEAGVPVELQPGPNRKWITRRLPAAGERRFRAVFKPDRSADDTIASNNEGRAFTVVSGQGEILILTTLADESSPQPSARILERALQSEQLACSVQIAGEFEIAQDRLLTCSAVILNNVPANDLRQDEKETLAAYVRELGGGLIMIGGEDSFGAGGWMGSPVEEVMPVSFDVKHKRQFLKGALVLCMHACEVERGNYLGERCAIEAVKTLSRHDLVGILAWKWQGGDQGHWVVPLQSVGDRARIVAAIKQMSMGDLPYLDEVMRPGVTALAARKDVGPKHMIVISDFDPSPPKDDLLQTMKKHGITCTTIAIGYGGHYINEGMAQSIANATGGRFYRTRDLRKLPQIFIKESREVRRSLIQEGNFQPRLARSGSPVVSGMYGETLPPLRGFVLTTRKPLADMPIYRSSEDETDDPILAHWRVGLGKAVAFTSGMWSRWGPDWTAWPKFTKFWGQLARWASRQAQAAELDVTTSVHGGRAKIRIDALDKNAAAVKDMQVIGRVVNPDNEGEPLRLTQTGPGRFEAEFDARDRGNYIVKLAYSVGEGEQARSGSLQTGVSVAYSPEYAQTTANLPLLEELRARTNGRALAATSPATAFDRGGLPRVQSRRPIWESLLHWMLLLFLIDVAVRRIAINPVEVYRKARGFLADMAGRGRPAAETAAVLTTLKSSRERRREERQTEAAAQPDRAARYEARTPDLKATEDLGRALGGATQQDAPVVARPTGRKPAQSEAEYTSRLLRAKRRARKDMEDSQNRPGN